MRQLACVVISLSLVGCGGGTTSREPDEYTGCASDEHWRTFEDQAKQTMVSDAMAPLFTSPAPEATLTTKVLLAWNQDPNDVGQKDGDVPYMGVGCNNCCPQFNTGSLSTLHLPPISGSVYDLHFTVDGSVVHRVITTLQEWGPSDSLWASWAGKTVTVQIWRLILLQNDVKAGPYTPTQPLHFSVAR